MKANELRVGNIVMCLGKEVELIGISKWNGNNYTTLHYAEFQGLIPMKLFHLKPVPLTEEWLDNFGFDEFGLKQILKTDIYLQWDDYVKGVYLSTDIGDGSINDPNTEINGIKYVHQLQNLYLSLVGEELELKASTF